MTSDVVIEAQSYVAESKRLIDRVDSLPALIRKKSEIQEARGLSIRSLRLVRELLYRIEGEKK